MTDTAAIIYPALIYRDAPAAIDFLEQAFGFRRLMVVPAEGDSVAHAELAYGAGIIMLGSERDEPSYKSPRNLAGIHQTIYVFVDNAAIAEHYTRAKSGGAEITRALETKDYGGSGYSARDVEGHEWSFGSYRPTLTPTTAH